MLNISSRIDDDSDVKKWREGGGEGFLFYLVFKSFEFEVFAINVSPTLIGAAL